jgi:hypothetical protein
MILQRYPDSRDRRGSREVLGAATMPDGDDAAGGIEVLPSLVRMRACPRDDQRMDNHERITMLKENR